MCWAKRRFYLSCFIYFALSKRCFAGADDATLQRLKSDWKDFSKDNPDARVLLDCANKLIKALEEDRAEAFDSAKRLTFETAQTVVTAAEYEASEEIKAAWKEAREQERRRRKIEIKSLSKKQLNAVLNYSPIEGETVAGWFQRWQSNDLERIAQAVRQGAIDSLSVNEITRKILGTRENNFQDGIVQTSRTSAQTVARTIINGVSNVARFETMRLNSDALDGVQFLATLDARTSFICASLDGKIWKGENIKNAARPPLHPNCRSTLIPYIELVDKEGNVIEDDVTRAAANADFDKLAKDAYNADAKQRGLSRRWDDLAPSTRKKYYYKAQRDWEARHDGQNAYRQVPSKTTFKEYFESQDVDFKRSWLGAGRYQLYRSGQATLDDLIKPAETFRANVEDIFKPQISMHDFAQTAQIAEQRIDSQRVERFGLDRAIEVVKEINSDNSIINSYQDANAERNIWIIRVNEAKEKYNLGKISYDEYKAIWDQYKVSDEKRNVARDLFNARDKKREKDRKENERIIKEMFPDNGGRPFFTQAFIDKVKATFEAQGNGLGDIATEVFDMYNQIGRSVNTGGKTFREITDVLFVSSKDFSSTNTLGNFTPSTFVLRLNIDKLPSNPACLRSCFAHEIGHWIDNSGTKERTNANAEWLIKETKHRKISNKQKEPFFCPLVPDQHLCASPEGYSQRIYPNRPTKDQDANGKTYVKEFRNQTEVVSTAMEYMAIDAEAFLRRNPKHFDVLIANLREFSK